MAKESQDTGSKKRPETPFQRFEDLVRRIVRVPKNQIQDKPKS
jgi:hypothetical protein